MTHYYLNEMKLEKKLSFLGIKSEPFCALLIDLELAGHPASIEDFLKVWPSLIDKEYVIPEYGDPFRDFDSEPKWNELKRLGLRQKQLLKTIFKESETEFSSDPKSLDFKLILKCQ